MRYAGAFFEMIDADASGGITFDEYAAAVRERSQEMGALAAELLGVSSGMSFHSIETELLALEEAIAALLCIPAAELPPDVTAKVDAIRRKTGCQRPPPSAEASRASRLGLAAGCADVGPAPPSPPKRAKRTSVVRSGLGAVKSAAIRHRKTIAFGSKQWDFVLQMMIGIRTTVGRHEIEPWQTAVDAADFRAYDSFSLPSAHSDAPDAGYHFYDFAPAVFRQLRHAFGVEPYDYALAVSPEQLVGALLFGNLASVAGQVSEGKSGSFFFYTHDGRFLVKTMLKAEFKFMQASFLQPYYQYMQDFRNRASLLPRFMGMYALDQAGADRMHFVVMANTLSTVDPCDEIYDLKGSSVGRFEKAEAAEQHVVLKDLNWTQSGRKLKVLTEQKSAMLGQLHEDAHFLAKNEVMDYSLLVGVVKDPAARVLQPDCPPDLLQTGVVSSDRTEVYFIGIIDILIFFDAGKRAEHGIKGIIYGDEMSCVPPDIYAQRFCSFTAKVFETPEEHLWEVVDPGTGLLCGSAPGKMPEAFAVSAASKSDGIPPPKRGSILDSLRGHRDSIQSDDTKRSSRLGSLHAESC